MSWPKRVSVPIRRDTRELCTCTPPTPPHHPRPWGHSRKAAIGKPARQLSLHPDYAGYWSWTFQSPDSWEINSVVQAIQPVVFYSGSPSWLRQGLHQRPFREWVAKGGHLRKQHQTGSFSSRTWDIQGKVQSVLVTCKPGSPGVIIFRLLSAEMKIKVDAWTGARMRKRRGRLPKFLTASS